MNTSWFEENLAVLKASQPDLARILARYPPLAKDGGWGFPLERGEVFLEQPAEGPPSLSLDTGSGRRRLTSARDPQKEDSLLADDFLTRHPPAAELTLAGLGLGYHAEYLLEKLPQTRLQLWEGRPQLAAAALAARDLRKILADSRVRLYLGPETGQAPISKAPGTFLARPANLRLDGPVYGQETGRRPARAPRVLFLEAGYYLGREIPAACRKLAAPVTSWTFDPQKPETCDYRNLLETVKACRPQLILTVNHLGLDQDGLLSDICRRAGLPLASWFVDSPVYILPPGPQGEIWTFAWDRDYLDFLKKAGLSRVFYLPLGSDPDVFAPGKTETVRRIAFVGDSLTAATGKYLALAGLNSGHLPEIDRLAGRFLQTADLYPETLAAPLAARLKMTASRKRNLWALITWRAARLSRLQVLKGLAPGGGLTVFGDRGWRDLLPQAALGGQADYYRDLAGLYRSAAVNLNITSAQMKTGLNQRVFDAPLAGGFLLTDRRAQLDDLFGPGETVSYSDPREAALLAAEYLQNPSERERITALAQKRILGEHLYTHRLQKIFQTVLGSTS